MDWIAERNLEVEERHDQIRSEHQTGKHGAPDQSASHKFGGAQVAGTIDGSDRVRINPNLRVVPNPEFIAWRERLRAEHGV